MYMQYHLERLPNCITMEFAGRWTEIQKIWIMPILKFLNSKCYQISKHTHTHCSDAAQKPPELKGGELAPTLEPHSSKMKRSIPNGWIWWTLLLNPRRSSPPRVLHHRLLWLVGVHRAERRLAVSWNLNMVLLFSHYTCSSWSRAKSQKQPVTDTHGSAVCKNSCTPLIDSSRAIGDGSVRVRGC